MRDVDADWATVLVTRTGEAFDDAAELAGRRLALGSRDSGHAAILPLHYLAEQGLDAERECELRALRHRPRQARRHRRLRAARRARGRGRRGRRRRAVGRVLQRLPRRGPAGGRRARGRLAQPDLLPLQLHRAATASTRTLGAAVERGAAGDGLRRPVAAPGDGARGRPALAAGRSRRATRRWPRRCARRAASRDASAHRIDAEQLELGGGLEVLLAAALERVPAGGDPRGQDAVARRSRSSCPAGRAWPGTQVVGERERPAARGACRSAAAPARACSPGRCRRAREAPPLRAGGELHTGDWRAGAPPPAHADPAAGFAPLGAVAERGRDRLPLAARRPRPASGPTTSASSPSRRPRSSGTPRATSRGRPRAGCPTTSSAPSPRS